MQNIFQTGRSLTAVAALAALSLPAVAQAQDYAKFQLGVLAPEANDAYWLPPGYPGSDPQVNFGLGDLDKVGFASAAVGRSFQNGLRADLELLVTGKADATGDCSSASDGTPCSGHADISDATVRTSALLANVSYEFMQGAKVQPYVTAGAGVAWNKLSDWTRSNPAATRPERTFDGDTQQNFAWTAGVGASYEIAAAGRPMFLDVSWRYFDFGEVEGGTNPQDTAAAATKGLNFDLTGHALAMGLRIPF